MRPCLSPELVSLVSLTFHFSDELICGVVFWLGVFVCLFGFAFVADWIMLIRRASFRASSFAMFALGVLVACLASLPRCSCFTCSVRTPSHSFHSLQRLLVVVVFLVVLFFFVCLLVFWFLLGLVWFPRFAFASLHAFVPSLTGAQRTDSSPASKKIAH